jgi:pimeloyl-ACP methyl ester carboxylesterase
LTWHGHRVEQWILETEPGLPLPAVLCIPRQTSPGAKRPALLVVDERGKQFSFERGLVQRLADAGFVVLALDVRGAGETAGTLPMYDGAHDFNLSNYSLFCGRPMPGMMVHDVRCAVDFLAGRPEVDASRIAYAGRGIAGLVGILAAAYDPRVRAVAAEETLSTWVLREEFFEIGLSYLIPRILTVGDMGHLAACVAPRPLWLVNAVDGRRRPVSLESARQDGRFADCIYTMHQSAGKLSRTRSDDVKAVPDRLVEWLTTSLSNP